MILYYFLILDEGYYITLLVCKDDQLFQVNLKAKAHDIEERS